MTIEDMLNKLDKEDDSPFYDICNYLDEDNFCQAVNCIKEYFNCDDNTAKIVCMDFKTKIYDDIFSTNPNLANKQIDHNNQIARDWQNKPKCITCGSTNIKKISTSAKAINTLAFGLLGTKRNKTFHCNNCGYEW
jgi:hypothetical protein